MPARKLEDRVEDILEVKVLLFERSIDQLETNLSLQIAQNREVVGLKIDEVTREIIEVKEHLKTLNGTVLFNTKDIINLKKDQSGHERFRKGVWWFIGAVTTAGLFAASIAIVNHL